MVVFIFQRVEEQAFVATVLLVCSVCLTIWSRPYSIGWVDLADAIGQIIIIVCILIGWAFCGPLSEHSDLATIVIVVVIVTWAAVLLTMFLHGWFQQCKASPVRCDSSTPGLTAPLLMQEDEMALNGAGTPLAVLLISDEDAVVVAVEDAPAATTPVMSDDGTQ
jgi:hypothetical protein